MGEKINKIINNEKLRGFYKKVFTKKKIGGLLAAIVIIVGLNVGYSLAFEVKGTVLKADTKSIVVRNFLGTKTVNLGDYPLDSNNIVVGERIEIKKNISGEVIDIRTGGGRGGDRNFGQAGKGRRLEQAPGQGRNGKGGFGEGNQMQGKNGQQGTAGQQGSNNQQTQNGQQTANNQQAPSGQNGQGAQPSAPAQAPANNQ